MCGADYRVPYGPNGDVGSSPRVRSRLTGRSQSAMSLRIISACAEQTCIAPRPFPTTRDHLRVCGADPLEGEKLPPDEGSSPRVRSRHCRVRLQVPVPGIISACAEQTSGMRVPAGVCRDHLRVCGADRGHRHGRGHHRGSSPRVRSRRPGATFRKRRTGIISACAEQTSSSRSNRIINGDHLRVCGADALPSSHSPVFWGSSPRVRSRRPPRRHPWQ